MLSTAKPLRIFFITGAMFVLSACGGAPTEVDIKSAIDKKMTATATSAMALLGGNKGSEIMKSFIPEVKSVKLIGCKGDGEKAYKCDVEMEIAQMGSTNKGIAPMRFVKGSDGWTVSE
ncbi:MAG: hypothetical protein Q8K22_11285 [Rhodoferax sp.]|nr:hypothetical protein [Rhodoferax sp.]